MAVRLITIPVGESLPVGENVQVILTGRVVSVSRSMDAPGGLDATLEIADPAVAAETDGFDNVMSRWNQPRPPIRVTPAMGPG